jgi:hypothetical protein
VAWAAWLPDASSPATPGYPLTWQAFVLLLVNTIAKAATPSVALPPVVAVSCACVHWLELACTEDAPPPDDVAVWIGPPGELEPADPDEATEVADEPDESDGAEPGVLESHPVESNANVHNAPATATALFMAIGPPGNEWSTSLQGRKPDIRCIRCQPEISIEPLPPPTTRGADGWGDSLSPVSTWSANTRKVSSQRSSEDWHVDRR